MAWATCGTRRLYVFVVFSLLWVLFRVASVNCGRHGRLLLVYRRFWFEHGLIAFVHVRVRFRALAFVSVCVSVSVCFRVLQIFLASAGTNGSGKY